MTETVQLEVYREDDDGTEDIVHVTAIVTGATRGSWDEPPRPTDVEIVGSTLGGVNVELTPDEIERVTIEAIDLAEDQAADSGSSYRLED